MLRALPGVPTPRKISLLLSSPCASDALALLVILSEYGARLPVRTNVVSDLICP